MRQTPITGSSTRSDAEGDAVHGPSPTTAPGVRMHDLLPVSLAGAGTIDHVVNDTGGPVTPTYLGPSTVVTYP